ncbi:MAG: D-alanine--D-alanine ligase [Thermodesulfovibrio sp.]|nr:D-alanine--D-alanine ligase [Thermodesulfovibrio sp.]
MDRKMLKKIKIGVLMGGQSAEREVSLRSGAAVVGALTSRGYAVKAIDAGPDLVSVLKKEKIGLAFIALHGGHGENGALQGMLEIMGIPYTGSGVLASALAMDKEASKKIFLYHGIPVPACRIVRQQEFRAKGFRVATGFKLPWVVKPATEGSSVGVEIVKTMDAAGKAVKKAFAYGSAVVIEQYIKGKEVQIAILNDRPIGGVEVRPSLEFYSYEAKYTAGLTEYVIPPVVDSRTYKKAEEAALAAHRALGCSGATRVDLIVDDRKKLFVLEVNTIPGMTETSLLPKIAAAAGMAFPLLIEKIMQEVAV